MLLLIYLYIIYIHWINLVSARGNVATTRDNQLTEVRAAFLLIRSIVDHSEATTKITLSGNNL